MAFVSADLLELPAGLVGAGLLLLLLTERNWVEVVVGRDFGAGRPEDFLFVGIGDRGGRGFNKTSKTVQESGDLAVKSIVI